jgi:hypothetical protein
MQSKISPEALTPREIFEQLEEHIIGCDRVCSPATHQLYRGPTRAAAPRPGSHTPWGCNAQRRRITDQYGLRAANPRRSAPCR